MICLVVAIPSYLAPASSRRTPAGRWRSCCGRGTPDRTRWQTMSKLRTPPMTGSASPTTGLGSPTSPACRTWMGRRRACESPSAGNARIWAPAAGHRHRRALVHVFGDQHEEPVVHRPQVPAPPTRGARTASGPPRTPACATSRCTDTTRTRSDRIEVPRGFACFIAEVR